MKQEPGNASSQESPGFSRGEEVNFSLALVGRGSVNLMVFLVFSTPKLFLTRRLSLLLLFQECRRPPDCLWAIRG